MEASLRLSYEGIFLGCLAKHFPNAEFGLADFSKLVMYLICEHIFFMAALAKKIHKTLWTKFTFSFLVHVCIWLFPTNCIENLEISDYITNISVHFAALFFSSIIF